MGNTVAAADLAAAQILYPNTPIQGFKHPRFHDFKGEIPEDCPMHKKHQSTYTESGCPINQGQDDINPLNMVRKFLDCL